MATCFAGDMNGAPHFFSISPISHLLTRKLRYLLSCLMLSVFSARAEAPAPSQEFWNYFVEFGDAQGELFDPSDYAAVANLPAKAKEKIDGAATNEKSGQVPGESRAVQESSQ